MGHDITAIKDFEIGFEEKNKIAYLRRGMGSETIKDFYISLDCKNNYAGCSGDGNTLIICLETLEESIEEIKKNIINEEDKEDYLDFIKKCINYCKKNKKTGVIINFG